MAVAPESPREASSRRQFLRQAMAAGLAGPLVGSIGGNGLIQPAFAAPRSANEKLRLLVIGVAARGGDNLNGVAHEDLVGLCDIDEQRLDSAASRFPNAKRFFDCREALEMPDLDGVVISTPDHMHAIPASIALRKGIAVYCEKPLTHSALEARTLRRLAKQAKVATQMGNQIHSGDNYRRVVETIRSGVIGPVARVHVWLGNGVPALKLNPGQPVPGHIHYDLWVGPAPFRPYDPAHFHFQWRYWFDFGGGQLGDFGCHYMDLPFWALELGAPTEITAKGEVTHGGDNDCPNKLQVDYHFPARGGQPPVHLTWYHGGGMPAGAEDYKMGSAVLFEGTDGRLIADYGTHKVFAAAGNDPVPIRPWIASSVGHHQEWLNAIRQGGGATASNFEYAGNLTEAVHLGNVAYRAGQTVKWDAEKFAVTNNPSIQDLLHRPYREGWTL